MNHLESLVTEWLQFNRYFVRTSVHVGARERGGFEGELDVVGLNFQTAHLIHVECSLDSLSSNAREPKFAAKFERGVRFKELVFPGLVLPEQLDQVALLQYASSATETIGGARLVTVKEFVAEIMVGLEGKSPASGAVPATYPLLRTLQLAADAKNTKAKRRLIPAPNRTSSQKPDPAIELGG